MLLNQAESSIQNAEGPFGAKSFFPKVSNRKRRPPAVLEAPPGPVTGRAQETARERVYSLITRPCSDVPDIEPRPPNDRVWTPTGHRPKWGGAPQHLGSEQFRSAPRTCRYPSGQPWRAVSWHSGFRGGAHGPR